MAATYVRWPTVGGGGGGSGTVTSVGLHDGSTSPIYNISGSPVTTSGTLTFTLATQSANIVFAGPSSGSAAQPGFRSLVAGDIPTLPYISTTLGATALSGGLTVSGNTLSASQSTTSTAGWLSSTDWNTFNGKQASGNYITALTGDGTASGPGSAALTLATVNSNIGTFASVTVNAKGLVTAATALSGDATTSSAVLTLATVNSNVGSFGSSTAIPSFTVNGKGLLTAASTNVVIAPAGTLSGTTLNSTVVTSSLTAVGTITSGTWTGTTIAIANGGTGQTSANPAFNALSPLTTKGDILGFSTVNARLGVGSNNQVLIADSTQATGLNWATAGSLVGGANLPTIQKFLSGSGTYTTPAGVIYITVQMVGGGGGGSGSGLDSGAGGTGGTGGNTTFGTTLLVANGGPGGAFETTPSAGGTASLGSGPIGIALTGGAGSAASRATVNNQLLAGGIGASTPFGGAGPGGVNSAGGAAAVNTGAGGGGGGGIVSASAQGAGTGGSAGGYLFATIVSPLATYSYAVGAAGTAGTAGTSGSVGGAGGSGVIIVTEYYANGAIGTATTITGLITSANVQTSAFTAPTFQSFLATNYQTFTVSSANATVGATYTNNGQTFTVVYTIAAGLTLVCSGTGAPAASGTLTKSGGTGDATITFSAKAANGTYILPSGRAPLYIEIEMVGAGGGGSGSGTSPGSGGSPSATTFGSSLLTCNGGAGSSGGATAGGTSTIGAGASGITQNGGNGGASVSAVVGGMGGVSVLGGSGGQSGGAVTGASAGANSGSGGNGAGTGGGGGSAGGYIKAVITSPSSTYTFVTNAGGAGGTAGGGGNIGGAGGSSGIWIREYYQ